MYAAAYGRISTLEWLLSEGGSKICERDHNGRSAVLYAAEFGKLLAVQCLLERGASITEKDNSGYSLWYLVLRRFLVSSGRDGDVRGVRDAAAVTALLRFMLLRGAHPPEMADELSPEHARLVQEGARLRDRLPAYLAQRRALLHENCPLITPLLAIVQEYVNLIDTEEVWSTGLGADPRDAATFATPDFEISAAEIALSDAEFVQSMKLRFESMNL
jgi:hypothetical protein